jgi:hypothetical protein
MNERVGHCPLCGGDKQPGSNISPARCGRHPVGAPGNCGPFSGRSARPETPSTAT